MDLKVEDVAELLQVSVATVKDLIAKGKIPSYKIHREYRFNRDEIEDWMIKHQASFAKKKPAKSKSAAAGKTASKKGTRARKSPREGGNLQFSLYRAILRGDVKVLPKGNKEELIALAMKEIASRYDLDALVLTDLFIERERMMSTSLGGGIGAPHTRDFLLPTHFDVILVAFPSAPIDYGAIDGKPVHTLFFLFACEDKNHLNLLAKLAYFSSAQENIDFLKSKPSKEALLDYVKAWEESH